MRDVSMKRIVFHFLAGLSLVFLAAVVSLWIRGEFRADRIYGDHVDRENHFLSDYWLVSERGCVEFHWNGASWMNISPLMIQEPFHWRSGNSVDVAQPTFGIRASTDNETDIVVFDTPRGEMRSTDCRSGGSNISSAELLEGRSIRVVLSDWFATLAASIMPAFWIWRRWKLRAKMRIGICEICGYDLRATPGRCPECGRVPQVRAGKK